MDGFLGTHEPLKSFTTPSNSLKNLENIAAEIPKLLLTGSLQKQVNNLDTNDFCIDAVVEDPANINLAMNFLSFLSHAYIWGDNEPHDKLPKS